MSHPVEDIAGYKVGTLGVQACVADDAGTCLGLIGIKAQGISLKEAV